MQYALDKAQSNKPTPPKPFPTRPNPKQPNQGGTPREPKNAIGELNVSAIGSLKAAIVAEKNPTSKINLLQDLRANLLASMQAEKNHVKATELQREFMSAEKKLAFSLLAERQLDPKAAKARRLIDFADRE
jgi:hypothetical protein